MPAAEEHPPLSIGALSRATGIPVATLRTWERRHGFPAPTRQPSGHRLYPMAIVERLRRMAEALRRGHRAGQVVAATVRELDALLESTPAEPAVPPAAALGAVTDLVPMIRSFDRDTLTRVLLSDCDQLGTMPFLDRRVAPLLDTVGAAWAARTLTITHEHFLSERLGDVLRVLRAPLEERARGPLVVLATLPGEVHTLGLQMAALALAHGGCRLLVLGAEVPPDELVAVARERHARAVGLSVSQATAGTRSARAVARLRSRLPRRTALVVGGRGAPAAVRGITVLSGLAAAAAWARPL